MPILLSPRSKEGFTMFEVLISVILLGTCFIAIGEAFFSGISYSRSIREVSFATLEAQAQLENTRTMGFSAIVALPASETLAVPSGLSSLQGVTFTRTVDNYGITGSDIRRVSVTVSWTSPRGVNLTRSIATLITRRGIDRQ